MSEFLNEPSPYEGQFPDGHPDRTYRGVIEMSQDVTHVRGLEGEKRLLDWE